MSISDSEWKWKYQINLVISNSNNKILELLFLIRVLLNTSIISLHYLVVSEHEDIIIINRVNNLDKCSDQNKEDNKDLFKNSNIKEPDVISS